MTFEEWFEQRFPAGTPEGSAARLGQFKDYLEETWEAGYQEGGRAQVAWQDYLDRYDD